MRSRLFFLLSVLIVIIASILVVWNFRTPKPATDSSFAVSSTPATIPNSAGRLRASTSGEFAPTSVYAHNLMLRKGPSFRFYVRWLHGSMVRSRRNVNPSFDEPDSFSINIDTGVLRANIGDIGNFLNASAVAGNSPLKQMTLSGDGDQIKLRGTLHKIISLPIELVGTISAAPESRVHIHVTKLSVLKIPFKGLLGGFHITLADLFHPQDMPGIQVTGNDVFMDTQKLLPPPHMHGRLTKVHIVNPDLEEIYGNAETDVARVEQWRNYIQLRDGTIDFGKLTMHHVDLMIIDISKDSWFDLDLNNYQAQLVNGYTRMTPQAGMQIFMPDLTDVPVNKANQSISMEWLKNRRLPPPPDVTPK